MKKLFLLAGAGMMLALGAPAAADAKPGKGKSQAAKVHTTAKGHIDMNRNGVPDWRERWIDRDRDGIDDRQEIMANRWGGATCPPGLGKRTPQCVPPGQVGREFNVGQRVPTGWGSLPYSRIPVGVRDLYELDDDNRYIYRNGTLYVVDPRTRLIENIIAGLVF